MKEQLFLRLMPETASVVWLLNSQGPQGKELSQGRAESLTELLRQKPELKQFPAIVLVPGAKVLTLEVEAPARWSRETLTWAVEEQITCAPDEVFVCPLGSRNAQGLMPVAIVDRELLADWRKQLSSAGLKVTALIPDYLAVPFVPDQYTAMSDNGQLLIRAGQYLGLSIPESWREQWQSLTEAQTEPVNLVLSEDFVDDVSSGEISGLVTLARLARDWQDSGISLLQDEFRLSKSRGGVRRFAPALVILVATIVIQAGVFAWDSFQLLNKRQQLDNEISTLFHQVMGPNARQINPVHRLKNRLAELESGPQSSFLAKLEQLTQIWPQEGAVLQEIRTDQDNLLVSVQIRSDIWPGFEQLLSGYSPVKVKQVRQPDENGQQQVQLEVEG